MSLATSMVTDESAEFLAEDIVYALAAEAAAESKPGLVTASQTASHTDMDVFTLLRSACSLRDTFRDAALLCANLDVGQAINSCSSLFAELRSIGRHGEQVMFRVTGGVNTHKGGIFLGVLLAAAARIVVDREPFLNPSQVCLVARQLAFPALLSDMIFSDDDSDSVDHLSGGLRAWRMFGVQGIRGEVISGFSSVLNNGIPALELSLNRGVRIGAALTHTLISLMAVVQDSTVLNRVNDPKRLVLVQDRANDILANGSIFTKRGNDSSDVQMVSLLDCGSVRGERLISLRSACIFICGRVMAVWLARRIILLYARESMANLSGSDPLLGLSS